MKFLKNKDVISGITLILLAAWLFAQSFQFKVSNVSLYGAATVPRVTALFLAILAAGVLRDGLLAGNVNSIEKISLKERLPEYLTYILLFAYVILIKPLGFVITSALYLSAQMYILSNFNRKWLPVYIAIGCISSPLLYYMFRQFFDVFLPNGILK